MGGQEALHQARGARFDDAESRFEALAEVLLNRVELRVADVPCRPAEVEVYLLSGSHVDPFTHGHAIQAQPDRWYLHRVGAGYKQGSFKGLDLTFGDDGIYGGVLVRSLATPEGSVIDGPCLCVEYVMKTLGCVSVADLDARVFPRSIWDPTNALHLVDRALEPREVHATARVGLTLKRIGPEQRPEDFIVRGYRFVNRPRAVKKGRVHLVLSLLERGWSVDDIRGLTGSPAASIRRYADARQAGRGGSIDDVRGQGVDAHTLCRLHGLLRP